LTIDSIAERMGVTRRAIQDRLDVAAGKLHRAARRELDAGELEALIDMRARPRGRRKIR
jgi:predicted transcriptional regulator